MGTRKPWKASNLSASVLFRRRAFARHGIWRGSFPVDRGDHSLARLTQLCQLIIGQRDFNRPNVRFQVVGVLRSDDGRRYALLVQQPGDGDLGRRHTVRIRDVLHQFHKLRFFLQVIRKEQSATLAEIVVFEFFAADSVLHA